MSASTFEGGLFVKKSMSIALILALAASACVDDSPDGDETGAGLQGADEFEGTPEEGCPLFCDWFTACIEGVDDVESCANYCVEMSAAGTFPYVLNNVVTCTRGAGCSEEEVGRCLSSPPPLSTLAACLEAHPEGVEADDLAAVAAPGSSSEGPTMADIAATCRAAGATGCEPASWIGKDAAVCIATEAGFEQGVRPWDIIVTFDPRSDRPTWVMWNTTEMEGDASQGFLIFIDAGTGEVLTKSHWSVQP